jgi:hypothetical protein
MAVITGTNGNDNLTGTAGPDMFYPMLGVDTVDGLGGTDSMIVEYSDYFIDPFAGAAVPTPMKSVITSSQGAFGGVVRTVYGGQSVAFAGIEHLYVRFDQFNNFVTLDASAALLGATLDLGGGDGIDTLQADFTSLGSQTLDFSSGTAPTSFGGMFSSFEILQLQFGSGSDNVTGGSGKDTLAGGGGSDTLDGGAGDDTLYSGSLSPDWQTPYFANNFPYTPPVLDTGAEVDTLRGGSGWDRIFAGYGDVIDGGADGADLLISLQGSSTGLTIDFRALANGGTLTVGGGLISNIKGVLWVEGSNHDDFLTGSDMPGYMNQSQGPIFGLGGDDHLVAGLASGNLYGGEGNDVLDSIYNLGAYYGEGGDDVINSLGRIAQAFGGDGNDIMNVAGIAQGGAGNDVVTWSTRWAESPAAARATTSSMAPPGRTPWPEARAPTRSTGTAGPTFSSRPGRCRASSPASTI